MTDTQDPPKAETPVSPEDKRRILVLDWHNREAHHTGSQTFYPFSPIQSPRTLLTEGAKDMAEFLACFWLMDIIASAQIPLKSRPPEEVEFQVWRIIAAPDGSSAKVACDTAGNLPDEEAWDILRSGVNDGVWAYSQDIGVTTFPLETYKLYCQFNGEGFTIMLPGEY